MSARGHRPACRARCCRICCDRRLRSFSAPRTSPALWRWLRRWLRECDLERYRRNRARMQRLAFYSQAELRAAAHAAHDGIRTGHGLPAAVSDRAGSRGVNHDARAARRARRSSSADGLSAVPRTRAGAACGDAAGRRPALARRRDRQLRLLRTSVEGHRHTRRSRLSLRRRRPELRTGAGPHRKGSDRCRAGAGRRLCPCGRSRQCVAAAAYRHPPAAAGRQGLLCHRHHHRLRACALHQRDGRNVQGCNHAPGQPPARRGYRRARHPRHGAARQRLADAA